MGTSVTTMTRNTDLRCYQSSRSPIVGQTKVGYANPPIPRRHRNERLPRISWSVDYSTPSIQLWNGRRRILIRASPIRFSLLFLIGDVRDTRSRESPTPHRGHT